MTVEVREPEVPEAAPQDYVDVTERPTVAARWVRRLAVTSIAVAVGLPMLSLVVWSFAFRWNFRLCANLAGACLPILIPSGSGLPPSGFT